MFHLGMKRIKSSKSTRVIGRNGEMRSLDRSIARWALNLMNYAHYLLFDCCPFLTKISCFKGLNEKKQVERRLGNENETSRIEKSMSNTSSSHLKQTFY